MNILKSVFLFVGFSFSIFADSQEIELPQNELFQRILADSTAFTNLGVTNYPFIPQSSSNFNHWHVLIKKPYIYIIPDGTGKVYQSVSQNRQTIKFKRIDSSFYGGYHFDAKYFFLNNQLYSFGGYGFWKDNGHLRKLVPQNGWEIVPLNTEIPFCAGRNFNYFDGNNLYWVLNKVRNEGLSKAYTIDSCYQLDLLSNQVHALGKSLLNNNDLNGLSKFELSQGILVENYFENNRSAIFDFVNNTILKEKSNSSFRVIKIESIFQRLYYYKNDFIYFSVYPFNKIDSVQIKQSDFENTGLKIYEPNSSLKSVLKFSASNYIWILLIILLLIPYYFFLSKKETLVKSVVEKHEVPNNFEHWEMVLLKELLDKILHKGFLTVEDFNNKLGVGYKTLEVQKKTRNDFINIINTKFKTYFQVEDNLITRERNEEDKRIYKYKITETHFQLMSTFIQQHLK